MDFRRASFQNMLSMRLILNDDNVPDDLHKLTSHRQNVDQLTAVDIQLIN